MDQSLQVLWGDGERVLFRGSRPGAEGGQRPVLAVLHAADRPPPLALERLAHEYGLRNELDGAWAARPLEFVREDGRAMLVLEDPGGEPLARLLGQPMEIGTFLRLAIGIAAALGKAHQAGLVHKDLKPGNILVNCADGATRLTGFGIATRLPRERQTLAPPETIAGTLAYMAPEQTGRMNRSIDSRSDLYSLGVVFYQMLTGALPFTASDPMEWVHCHVARKPAPPRDRVETVPATLSKIVLKLLAKAAEERYQGAAGLERDLRRCLADWERQRRIDDFPLGSNDTPDRLLVPETLYGRAREVASLLAGFQRIVRAARRSWCWSRDIPASASPPSSMSCTRCWCRCARSSRRASSTSTSATFPMRPWRRCSRVWCGLCWPRSDAELAAWRAAFLEALEPNARLMTDLIPELKLIIGEPPPVPELEPRQAQSRFQLVFRRFIGVFAQPEHPLVLFFDDLQWLDAATLDLLEDLLDPVGAAAPDAARRLSRQRGRCRASVDAQARGDPPRRRPPGSTGAGDPPRAARPRRPRAVDRRCPSLRGRTIRAPGAAGGAEDRRQPFLPDSVSSHARRGGLARLRSRRGALALGSRAHSRQELHRQCRRPHGRQAGPPAGRNAAGAAADGLPRQYGRNDHAFDRSPGHRRRGFMRRCGRRSVRNWSNAWTAPTSSCTAGSRRPPIR